MDSQQDYNSLQNVKKIDEGVLNTPAQEQQQVDPTANLEQNLETYFEMNKPGKVTPQKDVILDLDGKKVEVKGDLPSQETQSALISDIYGQNAIDDENKAGGYVIFALVIVGLVAFIMMNLKRSEYILNLEHEINKLKHKNNA